MAKARAKPGKAEADRLYGLNYRKINRAKWLVKTAKHRAIKHNWPFDLDKHVDQIQEIINQGKCQVTGLPFDLDCTDNTKSWAAPSIDQITPASGYVWSNVRIVIWAFNAMCGTWGEDKIFTVVDAIRRKQYEG